MEIKIKEEYEGEFEEKKDELIKALFPNARSLETLKIPERNFKEKSMRQIHADLSDEYKKMMDDMFSEIELKLLEYAGK